MGGARGKSKEAATRILLEMDKQQERFSVRSIVLPIGGEEGFSIGSLS